MSDVLVERDTSVSFKSRRLPVSIFLSHHTYYVPPSPFRHRLKTNPFHKPSVYSPFLVQDRLSRKLSRTVPSQL